MKTDSVKVKFLKPHYKYAYFENDIGIVNADHLEELIKGAFVTVFPGDDGAGNVNPLPNELEARELLFENGFTTLEDIVKAGESLQDINGIGKATFAKIMNYATAKI
jgi:hypothetical protein